jgi:hypothetical protein
VFSENRNWSVSSSNGRVELSENVVVEFEWLRKRDGQVRAWSGHRFAIRAGTGDIWRLD